MTKSRIMVVDDDAQQLDLMGVLLAEYDFCLLNSGKECLQKIADFQPDIVILDVLMPEMDGYETCRKLKANKETNDIPVIFVSASEDERSQFMGFEAGGDDYFVKPFDIIAMKTKLQKNLDIQNKYRKLKRRASLATETAKSAMQSASELGDVIRFIEDISRLVDYEKLGESYLKMCNSFGLRAVVQLKLAGDVLALSDSGYVKPLEEKLINREADSDRVLNYKQHSIFNYPRAAALISNMPIENEGLYGRLKDHLCVITQSVDNQVKLIDGQQKQQQLEIEKKSAERQQLHSRSLDLMTGQLENIREIFNEFHIDCCKLCEQQLIEIEAELFSMGLDEQQEVRLIQILEENNSVLIERFQAKEQLEESFQIMLEILTDTAARS